MSSHNEELEKAFGLTPPAPSIPGWTIGITKEHFLAENAEEFEEYPAEDPEKIEWMIDWGANQGWPFGIVLTNVWATTKEQALEKFKDLLQGTDEAEIKSYNKQLAGTVYFYPENLSDVHIIEVG